MKGLTMAKGESEKMMTHVFWTVYVLSAVVWLGAVCLDDFALQTQLAFSCVFAAWVFPVMLVAARHRWANRLAVMLVLAGWGLQLARTVVVASATVRLSTHSELSHQLVHIVLWHVILLAHLTVLLPMAVMIMRRSQAASPTAASTPIGSPIRERALGCGASRDQAVPE